MNTTRTTASGGRRSAFPQRSTWMALTCQLHEISARTHVHCTKYGVSRPKQRAARAHCQWGRATPCFGQNNPVFCAVNVFMGRHLMQLTDPAQRGTARRLDESNRATGGPGAVRGRPGAPDAQRPAGPNTVRARVALRGDDAPSHGGAGATGYHRTRCAGGMRRSRTPVHDACGRQRPSAGVHRRRLHIACSGKLPAPHGGSAKSDAQELGTEPVARGRTWNHENAWCSPSRDEACSRERSGS